MNNLEQLIGDCRAIITEHTFTASWSIITGYHLLGKRVLEESDLNENVIMTLAKGINKSVRTIQRAVQFAKQYPDLNMLPNGKAISWYHITNHLLPQPKEITDCQHTWVEYCKYCHKRNLPS